MTDQRATPVEVPLPRSGTLDGDLTVPAEARGLVAFAHGSGSSRHSPRNRAVAAQLQQLGLATLLLDLLTPEEERRDLVSRRLRFDLDLLAERLLAVLDWAAGSADSAGLPVGLFGASTGGGAALMAAARRPEAVRAVVSRGGRPDLAGNDLPNVRCPVLLLVGERDPVVLELNEQAQRRIAAPTQLHVVPGATHLFEEPGALEEVSRAGGRFFLQHLAASPS